MPLYDFYCESCDRAFEVRRSMRESTDGVVCPLCAGDHVRRLFTPVATFSSNSSGQRTALSGSGGCGGCAATSCSGCACGHQH